MRLSKESNLWNSGIERLVCPLSIRRLTLHSEAFPISTFVLLPYGIRLYNLGRSQYVHRLQGRALEIVVEVMINQLLLVFSIQLTDTFVCLADHMHCELLHQMQELNMILSDQ